MTCSRTLLHPASLSACADGQSVRGHSFSDREKQHGTSRPSCNINCGKVERSSTRQNPPQNYYFFSIPHTFPHIIPLPINTKLLPPSTRATQSPAPALNPPRLCAFTSPGGSPTHQHTDSPSAAVQSLRDWPTTHGRAHTYGRGLPRPDPGTRHPDRLNDLEAVMAHMVKQVGDLCVPPTHHTNRYKKKLIVVSTTNLLLTLKSNTMKNSLQSYT